VFPKSDSLLPFTILRSDPGVRSERNRPVSQGHTGPISGFWSGTLEDIGDVLEEDLGYGVLVRLG
jgi:hypothetical protein